MTPYDYTEHDMAMDWWAEQCYLSRTLEWQWFMYVMCR